MNLRAAWANPVSRKTLAWEVLLSGLCEEHKQGPGFHAYPHKENTYKHIKILADSPSPTRV